MSTPINDGGPAFPDDRSQVGRTLRDWFAGQALIGILLAPGQLGAEAQSNPDKAACWAYGQADAMIAARGKGTT